MIARLLAPAIALPVLAQGAVQPPPKAPEVAYFTLDAKGLALRCAEEADRVDHGNNRVQAKIGEVWLLMGDRGRAQAAFDAALKLDPKDSRVHLAVAQAWMRSGFREEALTIYRAMTPADRKWSFNNPKNVLTWVAVDMIRMGLADEAAGYMEKAYALDPRDASNCVDFGRAALMAEQRDLAARWFARAVKVSPKDTDILLDIASAHADYLLRAQKKETAK